MTLSLNDVSRIHGRPISTAEREPTAISLNQCAPIITRGKAKTTKIIRAIMKVLMPK